MSMLKTFLTQAAHLFSKAEWMRETNRSTKLNLLANRVGSGLLDIFDMGMDVPNTHVIISKDGGVTFALKPRTASGEDPIAVVKLSNMPGTQKYCVMYHDENCSNYEFQKIQNNYALYVTMELLDQIYGKNYI